MNTKDCEFLTWLADRLVNVYGENPNVDFVLATRRIAALASREASPAPLPESLRKLRSYVDEAINSNSEYACDLKEDLRNIRDYVRDVVAALASPQVAPEGDPKLWGVVKELREQGLADMADRLEMSAQAFVEDVYEQCAEAIKPLVDRGLLPGSVVESVQMMVASFDPAAPAPVAPTPAQPSPLMQALTVGIPLDEPVRISKALLAQRKAHVVLSGGFGPVSAVHLVNIGLTGWVHTPTTAEEYARGFNDALRLYRSALLSVAGAATLPSEPEGEAP